MPHPRRSPRRQRPSPRGDRPPRPRSPRPNSALARLSAGFAFYTCLPVPTQWTLEFRGIARLAPLVGLAIGAMLGLLDWGLAGLGMPALTRSAVVVVAWVGITGGLHLDGAIDAADGLAVRDPERRLEVMADSNTGAFGAIAAAAILLLKTAALADLETLRGLVLMGAAGWGRWGQLVAIACYPYLKPAGKGRMHKAAIQSPRDLLPGFLLVLSASGLFWASGNRYWLMALGMALGGGAIAVLVAAWFDRQLGGHTGDTYGAVVEWTEVLVLCLMTLLVPLP